MINPANPYRERIWTLLRQQLLPLGKQRRVLDFGCGDGWFTTRMLADQLALEMVPVDVKRRGRVLVEPLLYDGTRLPFESGSFDLSYSVDVVHHCTEPLAVIDELLRVTKRYLLLKDHTSQHIFDRMTLAVLDELGNRRFGIPSPHNYQHRLAWDTHIQFRGWRQCSYLCPAQVHRGLLGRFTNRLQYLALYERGP